MCQYNVLVINVKVLMSLPHSSTSEQQFSMFKLMKTSIRNLTFASRQ